MQIFKLHSSHFLSRSLRHTSSSFNYTDTLNKQENQQENEDSQKSENNENNQNEDKNQSDENKDDKSNDSDKNPENNNNDDGPSEKESSQSPKQENNSDRQMNVDQNVENILNAMKENEQVNKKRKQNKYSNEIELGKQDKQR